MFDNQQTSPRKSLSAAKAGREIALTIGAVAGLVCIVATIAGLLFGIKPLIFRSGSMSPEITTGSLALSRNVSATELQVGDVVSVENAQGTRITHRVHVLQPQSGSTVIVTLKGDANQHPDIEPYAITEADRVFVSVPGLGYAVAWLSSPVAIFLGGAFVGAMMTIVVRPAKKNEDSDDDRGPSEGPPIDDAVTTEFTPVIESKVEPISPTQRFSVPSFRTFLAVTAASLSVLGVAQATGTAAAFTDNATAEASISTPIDLLAAPKWLGCSGTLSNRTMKWEHLGPGYTYDIRLTGARGGSWNPTIPANKGDVISINVNAWDHVRETASGSQIEVRAVRNGQVSTTGWVGEKIWASGVATIYCDGRADGGNQVQYMSSPVQGVSARTAGPAEFTARTTAEPTTDATTSGTPAATTTSTPEIPTPSSTTATTPGGMTPSPTATTTEVPVSTTPQSPTTVIPSTATSAATTTTTVTDAPLGTEKPSKSKSNSAQLVESSETSQTAILVTDANSIEVTRILVSASAQYEWDPSTDILWIVDEGQLYKASGSDWTKTVVDPSSDDVPTDIAALIE